MHYVNSGATAKGRGWSASTGPVCLEVVWDLVGDWDLQYIRTDAPGGPYDHEMTITSEDPDGSFSGIFYISASTSVVVS